MLATADGTGRSLSVCAKLRQTPFTIQVTWSPLVLPLPRKNPAGVARSRRNFARNFIEMFARCSLDKIFNKLTVALRGDTLIRIVTPALSLF